MRHIIALVAALFAFSAALSPFALYNEGVREGRFEQIGGLPYGVFAGACAWAGWQFGLMAYRSVFRLLSSLRRPD